MQNSEAMRCLIVPSACGSATRVSRIGTHVVVLQRLVLLEFLRGESEVAGVGQQVFSDNFSREGT